jgi:predicted GIY-YIG superfamily endonuclease
VRPRFLRRRARLATMWFVYIVRCRDRTLYTGVTTDADKRVAEHNRGRGARYTRSRLPVELVHLEAAADRATALRREREIKRMPSAAKRRMISGAVDGEDATRGAGPSPI